MLSTQTMMPDVKDEDKSKAELLSELAALRERVNQLEATQVDYEKTENALRKSETRYQSLYDYTPAMLHSVDPYGRIISVSNRWLDTMGYELHEVIGRKSLDFFTEESRQYAEDTALPRLYRTGSIKEVPYQLVKKNGDVIDVLLSATVEKDDAGNMIGSASVLTDVTGLKRAEKEKRRLELQLEQTKKMEAVGTLAGGLAHDFNNILTAIMGNISLAQMHTSPDDKVFRFLNETEKALKRGRELTQKFIIFSKGGELEKHVTTIANLIKSTSKLSLEGSNIEYECLFPDDLWQVEIDEIQMSQVMSILIANTKDAQPGGGFVKIWAENVTIERDNMGTGLPQNKGNYVKVYIQDMGVGIPEEHLPRIFDPYFSTKTNWTQKGMGLGLATVYAIILRHDGSIHVESEEGIGTTVHIYLHAYE